MMMLIIEVGSFAAERMVEVCEARHAMLVAELQQMVG